MVLDIEAKPPSPPPAPKPASSPVQPHRAPIFENNMPHIQLTAGAKAYFEVKVNAYPPPVISWTRMGHPLIDKVRYVENLYKYICSHWES